MDDSSNLCIIEKQYSHDSVSNCSINSNTNRNSNINNNNIDNSVNLYDGHEWETETTDYFHISKEVEILIETNNKLIKETDHSIELIKNDVDIFKKNLKLLKSQDIIESLILKFISLLASTTIQISNKNQVISCYIFNITKSKQSSSSYFSFFDVFYPAYTLKNAFSSAFTGDGNTADIITDTGSSIHNNKNDMEVEMVLYEDKSDNDKNSNNDDNDKNENLIQELKGSLKMLRNPGLEISSNLYLVRSLNEELIVAFNTIANNLKTQSDSLNLISRRINLTKRAFNSIKSVILENDDIENDNNNGNNGNNGNINSNSNNNLYDNLISSLGGKKPSEICVQLQQSFTDICTKYEKQLKSM